MPKTFLTNIDPHSISRIVIQRKNNDLIEFHLQRKHWRMVSPLQTRANQTRIDAMLFILKTQSFAQINNHQSSLGLYQLDSPELILRLDKHEFHFGSTDPIDNRRYVRFNDTVHIINDNLFHQLLQPSMFFVSTKLIPDEEVIAGIEFAEQRISRVGGQWTVSPVNNKTHGQLAVKLVNSWHSAIARQVRQYDDFRENEKVIVTFESGRTAQFHVVSLTPGLILGRPDLALQYYLDSDVAAELFLPIKTTTQEN